MNADVTLFWIGLIVGALIYTCATEKDEDEECRKVTAIEEKVLALAVEWAKWDHERLRQRGFGNTGCYENSRAVHTNTNLQKAAKRLLKQRANREKK